MQARSPVSTTLLALFGFLVLIGLGTWQIQRLHWKEGLIAQRQAAVTADPISLPASLEAARALDFHRVRVSGHFLNDREFYLAGISEQGAAGFHVLTPLRSDDGSMVLVDRGFVPSDRRPPATRAAGIIDGETVVTGLLRLPPEGKPGWFVPDNRPERNEWYFVDLPAMAAADGLGGMLPFYVAADVTPNPGGYPVGGQTPFALPNDHLQYAIIWYALAAALVVMYMVQVRRRRGSGERK